MNPLLENLNSEQVQAVAHGEGPLMIIAGAGTGKTTVITKRIAWLIEQGKATPENILALTFTDKAANEMEERVDVLLPMGYVDLSISTFHAFCEKVLREHGVDIGLPQDFSVASEVDAWLMMRRHLSDFSLEYYKPKGNPTKFFRLLLGHFSRAKDEGIDPAKYIEHLEGQTWEDPLEEQKHKEVAQAYKTYQSVLLAEDALDFGDLLAYTVELFKTRPNILAKYRERFTYIVVDEFQDTNSVQYELVKLLASPKNNLTIVGDDDQAIYKFRGASMANILTFSTDFPNTKKIVLIHNYRSGKEILDVAYSSIIQNNPNRLEISEGLSKQLVSNTEHAGNVHHIHAATLSDEVAITIETIGKLHDDTGARWSDFAILARGNDHVDPFLEAMERAGIPYRFLALSGLYTMPIILDALAYLRVIATPHDSPSLYRVLSHPRLGLVQEDLTALMFHVRKNGARSSVFSLLGDVDAAQISLNGREKLDDIQRTITVLRDKAKRLPITELFVAMMKETGLLGDCQHASEIEQQELYRFLDRFFNRLKRFVAMNDDATLPRFLEEFDAERSAGEDGAVAQDPEEGPDVVSVMTVHGSKGLEFRYVFVINLVEQRFPSVGRSSSIEFPAGMMPEVDEKDDHLAEERRLFYVAMTRAKEGLYLLSADDYGGARKRKMSRFLAEIGFEPTVSVSRPESIAMALATEQIAKKTGDAEIHIPDKISFSQIAAFSTCPLQYKYAHIIGVPSYGKHQMSFGKSMHNALQAFMEQIIANEAVNVERSLRLSDREITPLSELSEGSSGSSGGSDAQLAQDGNPSIAQGVLADRSTHIPPLSTLLDMYHRNWIDEWYENEAQKQEYFDDGERIMKEYYVMMKQNPPRPKYLEKGFTLKVDDVLVKGRIDRIDDVEGGIEIIDYKTGESKTKLDWDDRRQLVLYAIAAEESFVPALVVKKLTYHYLKDNSVISFEPTDKDKEKLKLQIRESMEKIRTSDFKATPGPQCHYCDFKDICPYATL